ncbi:sugar fermentation stimulation protein [Roseovarius mucosus DSM 17069]|uniref:Sugar fermentation stimulation protein homolog n=1 Tax=Roseovarius mucosus DSM 17069 TaxID=1288298 RepID=A0A0A0HQ64_9RHOB|nr:DNA/RNA nuclease SfsA [Roseovarius mucosus]KGM88218.1 sugar fermentation stimulation protein [Roseovarius mucosus DSM 17069]
MRFQTPLVQAVLLRRYKRFLADIRLMDGREVTAHCANPGSMLGLAEPGTSIWVEPNDDPRKKLKFGWRLVENGNGDFTCVDTAIANRVVKEALEAGQIPELAAYDMVRPEQSYGAGSRVDFLLSGTGLPDAYVEVKSVTLSRSPGLAEFPDSVTARGARHLGELSEMVRAGHRAVLLYLVQRTDAQAVTVAEDIDPTYASALLQAQAAGVTVLSYRANITPQEVTIGHSLPLADDRPLVLLRK